MEKYGKKKISDGEDLGGKYRNLEIYELKN